MQNDQFIIAQANQALATLTTWDASHKYITPSQDTLNDINWLVKFLASRLKAMSDGLHKKELAAIPHANLPRVPQGRAV
jgi:hypothetical protein